MSLDSQNPLYYVVAASLFAFIGVVVLPEIRRKRKYRLPPQVPGIPIFGNLFQPPPVQQGEYFRRLAEKYGEM